MNVSILKLFCGLVVISFVKCDLCPTEQRLDITNGTLLENGSVIFEGLEYSRDEVFVLEENGTVVTYGCPCSKRLCLWKCCADGEMYVGRRCTPMGTIFNPPVYADKMRSNIIARDQFFFMFEQLCTDRYLVDTKVATEELYIQQNGSLYEISNGLTQLHSNARYCADMRVDSTEDNSPRLVAAVCHVEFESDDSEALYMTYAIGMLLSVPFLLATFLVYALTPELRNLHGLCLMAYCGGLIVAYPCLAYLKLHVGQIGAAMTGCVVIAFIVYLGFQTSFFWLNVMCVDIWRTFRGYQGGGSRKRQVWRRFLMYGLYAWGVPVLLTICTAAMQFSNNLPQGFIRPNFGASKCWFHSWQSELIYFFIPVFILVVCNMTLFAVTANRIREIRQETAILKGAESARSDKLMRDKQRYGLYLKLFVVMGVNWTIELISFFVGGSNWYWVIVDVSNIALGFFIFIIFVWKNKVRQLVMKRMRIGQRIRTNESNFGRWATRSSAPTEDTRVSASNGADEAGIRLKDLPS